VLVERRLILFMRAPAAGRVKTRLIPALGAEGAAELHRRLVLRTLRTAAEFCARASVDLELRFDGAGDEALRHWLGDGWRLRAQCEGDLGARMADAFAAAFGEGVRAAAIIGSDAPGLAPAHLAGAFEALANAPVVFGPAVDGGYYLIGLARPMPALFRGVPWGADTVLADSLRILEREGAAKPALLEPLADVDRPEDLAAWHRLDAGEEAGPERISVVVPALNEAAAIAGTLASVRRGRPHEIVVVDGGSSDATVRVAREAGARVLESARGRARQMNAGAARATGNVLLFLHADTTLGEGWPAAVAETLARRGVVAGAFRFRIEGAFAGKALVEHNTNLRSRWLGRPYGDQGLFLRRSTFEASGGFADLPLLEDHELVARLRRRGRVATADLPATTSGRRWKELGVVRTTLVNQWILAAYALGVAPERLARLYRTAATRSRLRSATDE
jgi:rSAM/selenodomain-associated transferase 2/rSAM/selenodomain-associated transferase 1